MLIKTDWSFEPTLVSPKMANDILTKNGGNRRLRKSVVKKYATIMANDEWVLTPEPIMVDTDGNMMNGQHRMSAVVVANKPVGMLIIRNVERSVFAALDRGAIRTTSDALGMEPRLVQVCNIGLDLLGVTNKSDFKVAIMAKVLEEPHEKLLSSSNTAAKFFSSAAVRMGAILSMLDGCDEEYVLETYRNLVLSNVNLLSPCAQAFVAAHLRGAIKTGGDGFDDKMDLMVRAMAVFDESRRATTKIIVKNLDMLVKKASCLLESYFSAIELLRLRS